jgi:hypothetical protein
LELDESLPLEENFEVVKNAWPADDYPFSVDSSPIYINAKGKKVLGWKIDQYGLTGELPIKEDMKFKDSSENITLIPMGAARLRISAFPVYLRKIE